MVSPLISTPMAMIASKGPEAVASAVESAVRSVVEEPRVEEVVDWTWEAEKSLEWEWSALLLFGKLPGGVLGDGYRQLPGTGHRLHDDV
jgi:hypothetical protein